VDCNLSGRYVIIEKEADPGLPLEVCGVAVLRGDCTSCAEQTMTTRRAVIYNHATGQDKLGSPIIRLSCPKLRGTCPYTWKLTFADFPDVDVPAFIEVDPEHGILNINPFITPLIAGRY